LPWFDKPPQALGITKAWHPTLHGSVACLMISSCCLWSRASFPRYVASRSEACPEYWRSLSNKIHLWVSESHGGEFLWF